MGKLYTTITWLEDREKSLLEKFNFNEEIMEDSIDEKERWILTDLIIKGFLYSFTVDGKKYYQGTAAYKQNIR